MVRASENSRDLADRDFGLTHPEAEQVWRATEELLHSPQLRSTAQCQQLLRYIVEHTLSGDPALLRERVIGKEVFGRPADYEPGEDPVVRIRAADLRKRLALYYQSLPQLPDVKLDVPSGSYRATFTLLPKEKQALPRTESEATSAVPVVLSGQEPGEPLTGSPVLAEPAFQLPSELGAKRATSRRWAWPRQALFATAALLVLFTIVAAVTLFARAQDPVRQFWSPMLVQSKPVLISIGSNAVYRVGDRQIDDYIAQNPRPDGEAGQEGMELFPPFRAEQSFASTGLYEAPNSFVALGDVAAASEMVQTFTRYNKEIEERFPNDISFAEVREHPTVLIGGANNPTTREMTRGVPFVRYGRNGIQDRDHPGRGWELHASPDSHDTDDYAIITRLAANKDRSPLVSVAGLGQYGTLAAAEFLCRPEDVATLRHALGTDWLKRNFQVVLRIKIIDFKPTSAIIVDQRMW